MNIKIISLGSIGAWLFLSSVVYAGNVTIPNSFTSGTPAVAAQVNANFGVLETGVNDNDSRINTNSTSITSNISAIASVATSASNNASAISVLQATLAGMQASISTLQDNLTTANNTITSLESELTAANNTITSLQGTVSGHSTTLNTHNTTIGTHTSQINTINSSEIMALNPYVAVAHDSRGPLVTYSGVNLQVVNGAGQTVTTNGLGNLIVGYDEARNDGVFFCSRGAYDNQGDCESNGFVWAVSHKTGSHYLVVGSEHNYTTFSGVVSGWRNTSNGYYASVTGGRENTASGTFSSVNGGRGNIASGEQANVSSGFGNIASGNYAHVSGGGGTFISSGNTASHNYSVILGGFNQTSTANSVANSADPRIDDLQSGVAATQTTVGNHTSQISAINNSEIMALDPYVTVANDSRGAIATFSGLNLQLVNGTGTTDGTPNGLGNLVLGYDTVRNGTSYFCASGAYPLQIDCENAGHNWAVSHKTGSHYLIIGDQNNYSQYGGLVVGYRNTSNQDYASVSGGTSNIASGLFASVSGGEGNTASGLLASVSGGVLNTALGYYSSVSGGTGNTAIGDSASVSGGITNTASGTAASVNGGRDNTASHNYSSILGGVGQTTSSAGQTIPALP